MFIKIEVSDNILQTLDKCHHQSMTFYRTKTPNRRKTLKYEQTQRQSAKPECNYYKSPSLQNKLFLERSQSKSSKKKARRGPNKSPAKLARDRKRHDFYVDSMRTIYYIHRQHCIIINCDKCKRFLSEVMEIPSSPESEPRSEPMSNCLSDCSVETPSILESEPRSEPSSKCLSDCFTVDPASRSTLCLPPHRPPDEHKTYLLMSICIMILCLILASFQL